MLVDYLQSAMRHANYEILSEDGSYYGCIPLFKGVYATAQTLEECRDELAEVLEEWVFLRLSRNLSLPEIDGIRLKVKKVA